MSVGCPSPIRLSSRPPSLSDLASATSRNSQTRRIEAGLPSMGRSDGMGVDWDRMRARSLVILK